ncbi:hypothetical protein L1887_16942 [Cichorium endivia]|nr:hypothetical protein L1887_16942 [Cichorium endivia]
MELQKVTVTGWVNQEKVLEKVRKTGRKAELWPFPYNPEVIGFTQQYANMYTHHSDPTTYFHVEEPEISTHNYYGHGYNEYNGYEHITYNESSAYSSIVGVPEEGKKIVVSNSAQQAPSYYDHRLNHPERYGKRMVFSGEAVSINKRQMPTPIDASDQSFSKWGGLSSLTWRIPTTGLQESGHFEAQNWNQALLSTFVYTQVEEIDGVDDDGSRKWKVERHRTLPSAGKVRKVICDLKFSTKIVSSPLQADQKGLSLA